MEWRIPTAHINYAALGPDPRHIRVSPQGAMEHFENTRKCTSNAVFEDPQQTSIEQLPNEVLAQIFYWVILYDDGTDNDPGACRCDDDGLDMHLMLSLVCSRWNAVTSSTPELWTGICNEDSLECTKLFLERSKSFPLDIRCHWRNQGRIASFMNLVLPHIGRWRSFWSSSQYFSGKLDQYFTQYSAPILESFSLNTPYVGSSATDIGRTQWISQNLFKKSAPLLKHLEIETDTISWSDPVIRGMSSLGVMDYGENEETSFWRYNCLLSGNQSLESLSIRRRPHPLEYAHARIPPICPHEIGPHANLRNAKLVGHTLSLALGAVSSIPSPLHPHPSIEILHCNVGQWVANARSDKFIHQPDSLLSKVMSSVTRFDIRNHVSVCLVEGFNENESGKTRVFLMAVDERLPPCSWLINALFPLTTDFSQLRALQLQATAASPGIDAITERLEGLPNLEDF
ncbi:hypothetical protein FRC02_002800, partial [Tulasnella sp. 418]